jgi:hypothetical protein
MTNAENRYDLLLTYLSEKGSGSWQELKSGWQWICDNADDPSGRAWVVARDLEALGHIEVAWNQGLVWCAAPPLLTMIPRSGGRVFVTGARTRHFLVRLREVAEAKDIWIDECGLQHGPTSNYLACSSHLEAEAIALDLEVGYTYQVAEQIAGLLPPLDSYSRLAEESELPRGLELELFDTERLAWRETNQREEPGLYRCRTYEGHLHGLLGATGRWSRVIKEVGIYEVLRWEKKSVLTYSEDDETLTLPAEASLPALHARAATLCCGRLPKYTRPRADGRRVEPPPRRFARQQPVRDRGLGTLRARPAAGSSPGRGTLTYSNVPLAIAERIAGSLSQVLEGDAA